MQLNCPNCQHRFALDHASEDECARALFGLLGRIACGRDLIAYLSLFRPRTQALRWSRALAFADDIEQLIKEYGDAPVAIALRDTIDALRPKIAADGKPLCNHNYFKRVLDSGLNRLPVAGASAATPTRSARTSKTAQGYVELESLKHGQ